MTIRRQDLAGLGQSPPVVSSESLVGLKPFVASPAVAVMRAQDKVSATSRRIALSSGLRGDIEWRVPNGDAQSAVRTHPDRTTWAVVARGRIEVTPGTFYRLSGAFVPSGETQTTATSGTPPEYQPDGRFAEVRVTVVWTDRSAATETTERTIFLVGSTLEFGREDTSAGGLWRTLRNFSIDQIIPPDVLIDPAELHRFSQHVTATITVEVRGSPRIVDLALYESPVAVAFDTADPSDRWTSHTYATGSPDLAGVLPTHARAETSAANPTGGTLQILATARAQALRLGPALIDWTAYSEEDASYGTTIIPRTTSNDGTTFESVTNASQTVYSASLPGWSVSCGGYARRWASCAPLVLRDRIACIPVLVRAYGRGVTAGTSTVRVQTARHSYVDLVMPVAGSASWHSAVGWLSVGISPDQPSIAQAFVNHSGAVGSLELHALKVYYCGAAPVV